MDPVDRVGAHQVAQALDARLLEAEPLDHLAVVRIEGVAHDLAVTGDEPRVGRIAELLETQLGGDAAAQVGRGLELVVTSLDQQPPARRHQGLDQRREDVVAERGAGRGEDGDLHLVMVGQGVRGGPGHQLAGGVADRPGAPKRSSRKTPWAPNAPTTPSGLGSSSRRIAQTHSGRRRPAVR